MIIYAINLENYARSLIICAINLENAIFQLESKQTCDHVLDASINTIKYLKGPHR